MVQHLQQPRIKLFDKLYGCFKIKIPKEEEGKGFLAEIPDFIEGHLSKSQIPIRVDRVGGGLSLAHSW